LVAEQLAHSLDQQFYVEHQPGAGGNIGMGHPARSASDGYTVMFVSTSFIVNPSLYPCVPYDDFAPVTPNVLVINPSIAATDVKELIAMVKRNPGKFSYASGNLGTSEQLSAEMFADARPDLVHVLFNGSAPAIGSAVWSHSIASHGADACGTAVGTAGSSLGSQR
jgi:tripartite-type tricarboxylate transporter receptor subunit TctC